MIISYKYGFIFVRTKKTASTAVELGLSPICGPNDVISPIGPGQELLRASLGATPRNFHPDKEVERQYVEAVKTGKRKSLKAASPESRMSGGVTGHMKARDVKALVGEDFWNKAYKFTTERHPFEKAVSLAHFTFSSKVAKKMTFEQHLEEVVRDRHRTWSCSRIYSIDGKSVMDGFLLHDTLKEDIARLRERLRLPAFELPPARAKRRKDRRPAVEVLTEAQKDFICQKCTFEFELFGWQRDGSRIPPPGQAGVTIALPEIRETADVEMPSKSAFDPLDPFGTPDEGPTVEKVARPSFRDASGKKPKVRWTNDLRRNRDPGMTL
jgi:hypothetical protein